MEILSNKIRVNNIEILENNSNIEIKNILDTYSFKISNSGVLFNDALLATQNDITNSITQKRILILEEEELVINEDFPYDYIIVNLSSCNIFLDSNSLMVNQAIEIYPINLAYLKKTVNINVIPIPILEDTIYLRANSFHKLLKISEDTFVLG